MIGELARRQCRAFFAYWAAELVELRNGVIGDLDRSSARMKTAFGIGLICPVPLRTLSDY